MTTAVSRSLMLAALAVSMTMLLSGCFSYTEKPAQPSTVVVQPGSPPPPPPSGTVTVPPANP